MKGMRGEDVVDPEVEIVMNPKETTLMNLPLMTHTVDVVTEKANTEEIEIMMMTTEEVESTAGVEGLDQGQDLVLGPMRDQERVQVVAIAMIEIGQVIESQEGGVVVTEIIQEVEVAAIIGKEVEVGALATAGIQKDHLLVEKILSNDI